jgi:hypothetical protein
VRETGRADDRSPHIQPGAAADESERRVPATLKRLIELPDEELERLLGLLEGADSVELKLTLPEADHRSTVAALGMDPLQARIRQIYFFDTPDLALNRHGIVARARRIQGKAHDSVVKLRPVVPDELPTDLRKAPGMVVEVDAMPGGYVCSASLKGKLGSTDVADAVSGSLPVRKLFSKQQRAFFDSHAPDGVEIDGLSILGPIFVLKLNLEPPGYDRRLVAEMWLYPDGSRILELSTKCKPSELFQTAAETRAYLAKRGVNISGEQQTKTKTALEFFRDRLEV